MVGTSSSKNGTIQYQSQQPYPYESQQDGGLKRWNTYFVPSAHPTVTEKPWGNRDNWSGTSESTVSFQTLNHILHLRSMQIKVYV